MKIVLADGCFDVIHVGHIEHLEEARKIGSHLIVALTIDEHVNKGPGRPLYPWYARARVLRALRCVSSVIPTSNAIAAIEQVKPDIFVKGIDYAKGDRWTEDVEAACKKVGAKIRFTKAPKQSVTNVIRRTMELCQSE